MYLLEVQNVAAPSSFSQLVEIIIIIFHDILL